VDILVDSVGSAVKELEASGGHVRRNPFDMAMGCCAVVEDPWGNQFVMVDMSKGPLRTNKNMNVV
jgi:predicted enzyme related to lactoylglutathione lyase